MNLENFASASAETQFWNLFPFGILHFNLKEGVGSGARISVVTAVSQKSNIREWREGEVANLYLVRKYLLM